MQILFYIFILITFFSCALPNADSAVKPTERNNLGQQVTLVPLNERELRTLPIVGLAVNQKGGAVIIYQEQHFWIDKLDSWTDKYLNKQVKVWGTLESRNDAPVFLDTSAVISQGIPVESEEELRNQAQRYWIINAKYKVVK